MLLVQEIFLLFGLKRAIGKAREVSELTNKKRLKIDVRGTEFIWTHDLLKTLVEVD